VTESDLKNVRGGDEKSRCQKEQGKNQHGKCKATIPSLDQSYYANDKQGHGGK
jgi:hypothetical protein